MNEHLFKAADDVAFLCDDLRYALAEAKPILALTLHDLLRQAAELRDRLSQLREAIQAEAKS